MAPEGYESRYGANAEIDVCHGCNSLWFDGKESLLLAPGSVIKLFRSMHERQSSARNRLSDKMACPRCGEGLALTMDLQRATRFNYQRCAKGCGRFITYFQWLRERNIVRDLTPRQLKELSEQVQTVRCSNCGAPVDIQKGSACAFCQAPVAALDTGAVEKALKELQEAETKRTTLDPTLPLRLLQDRQSVERLCRSLDAQSGGWGGSGISGLGLVEAGLGLLMDLLTSG
jgi:hypothetical protein